MPAVVEGSPAVSVAQPISGIVAITGTTPVSGTVTANDGTKTVSSGTWGNKSSVGTSAVQMVAASNPATKGVIVKADPGNSGKVAVALGSTMTYNATDATDGFVLSAGDSVTLPINNANLVWLIGSASGQRVSWMAL